MIASFASYAAATLPLLAQEETTGRGYTISWGLILLSLILGLLIALRPAKRDDRVRKARDDD